MAAKKFTTTIIVTDTRVTTTGKNSKGGTYTLYQVIATKPSGEPITLNLRSFEELPKNVPLEVDAELYESPQYGISYTLQRKGSNRGGGGGGGGQRIEQLEDRVKRIEDFLTGRGEFRGSAAPQQQQAPPAQAPPPPPPPPDPEPGPPSDGLPSDDAIPF